MINSMLSKIETQIHQSIEFQNQGDYSAALSVYEQAFEAISYYEKLGFERETEQLWRLVLEAQSEPAMALYFHGLIQFHRQRYLSAADAVNAAILLKPGIAFYYFLLARTLTALADFSGAYAAYNRIQDLAPDSGVAQEGFLALTLEKEMPGADYYYWLQRFHEWLKPARYVEVGLGHGRSLALAGPDTMAIGIDPFQGFWNKLDYVCTHGPATLFPLSSDNFFERYDLREVMGHDSFDLGFIDGLHLFEQALKDFINLERYSRNDSLILIHDCLPIAPIVAERDRCTGFWTGDVWRLIPCLKAFRPDLKIMTIPTKPSGLGVVTNLDSNSTVLIDNYDEIVSYYLTLRCPESFEQRRIVCNVESADEEFIKERFCPD